MQINIQKSTLSFTELGREEEELYKRLFPFTPLDFSAGLKYLGFQLKPNNYLKKDWKWLISKLEKRLSGWSFRWLSRAGRLTLTKEVLEAIPVYWMSLAWIPKGILEKIRKICSRFIWSGSRRKNHSTLGKMGPHSKTKGSRRVGSQKQILVLKITGS
jgi:hypothetical protein